MTYRGIAYAVILWSCVASRGLGQPTNPPQDVTIEATVTCRTSGWDTPHSRNAEVAVEGPDAVPRYRREFDLQSGPMTSIGDPGRITITPSTARVVLTASARFSGGRFRREDIPVDVADLISGRPKIETKEVTITSHHEVDNNDSQIITFTISFRMIDAAPPKASLAKEVIAVEDGYEIAVNYSDNVGIDVASVRAVQTIVVQGPAPETIPAVFVAVDNPANGTPRTATYRVARPPGGWNLSATYSVVLSGSKVKDVFNNFLGPATLASFGVPDTTPPTATAAADHVRFKGGDVYAFDVTFIDNVGVSVPSLRQPNVVMVRGPGGFQAVGAFQKIDAAADGTPRVTTFVIIPPGGDWDEADNGDYTITVADQRVTDTRGNYMAGAVIGQFRVKVPVSDPPPPSLDQRTQALIGVCFAVVLVAFLMYIVLRRPGEMSRQHYDIVRFLMALCAGCAGGFMIGAAFFNLTRDLPGGTLAVNGAAGFALFFTAFFFLPKYKPPTSSPAPDKYHAVIANGWTFRQAAEMIVRQDKAFIKYENLSDEELALKLVGRDIQTDTVADALKKLRLLIKSGAMKEYDVTLENGVYYLRGRFPTLS